MTQQRLTSNLHTTHLARRPKTTEKREPLYLLNEVADKLGMTEAQLRTLMKVHVHDETTPQPMRKPGNGAVTGTGGKCSYALSHFKKWNAYKAHVEAKLKEKQ